jgi:hypothetical protein
MVQHIDAKAAIWGGMVAGLVFLMAEMILIAMTGESPWGPPRMMAAIVMGTDVLPPPATFDLGIAMVGMIVHFVLSVIYGFVLGFAISRWRLGIGVAIVLGIVFGLLLYLVNFYLFTGLFPWFEMARNAITLVSHLLFGGVLGWVYRALAARRWTGGAD